MNTWFDDAARGIARSISRRDVFGIMFGTLVVSMAGGQQGCPVTPTSTDSGNGGDGGGGGGTNCNCSRGYTYNFSSRRCCPSDTPYYFPVGSHTVAGKPGGYCYASCPYVGDCGSSFQKC